MRTSEVRSGVLTRRVAFFVCADINRRGNLRHGNMSYVHSGSVLFEKQRVLCAEHAQTKSAPKPLQNTLHGKRALEGMSAQLFERRIRNLGKFEYFQLPLSFGGDTKSCRSLLSGVYARGVKYHTQG